MYPNAIHFCLSSDAHHNVPFTAFRGLFEVFIAAPVACADIHRDCWPSNAQLYVSPMVMGALHPIVRSPNITKVEEQMGALSGDGMESDMVLGWSKAEVELVELTRIHPAVVLGITRRLERNGGPH